jgi:hypothetical protein
MRGGDILERSRASIYDAALAPERWKAALDNLRAIAEATGRSIATVRTLLARLMAKTDTGRQTELIRLLANLPRSPLVG